MCFVCSNMCLGCVRTCVCQIKMTAARRKAEQDAQFRRRMTEKEASRRALQREKAARNAGGRRAGLRQLQLQQVCRVENLLLRVWRVCGECVERVWSVKK